MSKQAPYPPYHPRSKMPSFGPPRRRTLLRRLVFYALLALLAYQVARLVLPRDNALLLAVHYNLVQLSSLFRTRAATDAWILSSSPEHAETSGQGPYPVDMETQVGMLIKTGYGTRERLPAALEALGLDVWDPHRAMVVADYAQGEEGGPVIQDAVGELMKLLEPRGLSKGTRFKKYQSLKTAIEEGNESSALSIARNVGWELDALKFIWGLGELYKTLPKKDWYVILDDDSFLIKPSLAQLLSHLDPMEPYYLGNTVGDYKGRFAHGGSVVALSRAAVEALYTLHPQTAHEAQIHSLTETWGDRLLATTLQKIGIHVDERFNHMFNGEDPVQTRIWSDRFCSPIMSFHELKVPTNMRGLGQKFRNIAVPTLWGDVWNLFGGADPSRFGEMPTRKDYDFVGKLEKGVTKTSKGVESAEKCMKLCMKHRKRCLAWKWDGMTTECHTAPWMSVGNRAEGTVSGINGKWALELMEQCSD